MKAKIVSQKVYSFVTHPTGGPYKVKLLVVDNIAIRTFHDGQVSVSTDFDMEGCEILGEIEVPDELIEKALALIRAEKELNDLKEKFKALLL